MAFPQTHVDGEIWDGAAVTDLETRAAAYAAALTPGASCYLTPSGGDDSAAMASALTTFAPFAYPVVVLGPGTFNWGSVVPYFLRNTPAVVQGAGVGVTTIQLNGSARFFDFHKIADYDVFHHITIRGLTLDANNATGQNAGIGNYAAGARQTKIQWHDLLFEDIEGINGHAVDTAGTHVWRWFNLWSVSDESDTAMANYNIAWRDCRLSGGAYGYQVVGSSVTAGAHWSNTINDNLVLENCHHDTGSVPTAFPTGGSANYHFGSQSIGHSLRMVNCTGNNSWDVGIEIDGFLDAVADGCVITDNWGLGFFNTNFATIPNLQAQRVAWKNCTWVRSAQNTNYSTDSCAGWRSQTGTNFTTQYPAQVDIIDCKSLVTTGNLKSLGEAINMIATRRVNIVRFTSIQDGIVTTPNSGVIGPIKLRNGVGAGAMGVCHLNIKDLMVYVNGAVSLTGFVFNSLAMNNTGESYLDVDGFDVDYTLTGGVSTSYRGLQVGDSSAGQTTSGSIRRMRILQLSGDAAPAAITIQDTAWLTIGDKFEVTGCDWSKMGAGSEIFFRTSGGGSAQNGKVYAHHNRWRVNPVPVALTGIASTVGVALGSVVNTACVVVMGAGSGDGITASAFSTNAGTTYTNYISQSAGPIPAGNNLITGPYRPQDLIKVTFATTQPTITLVPVDP